MQNSQLPMSVLRSDPRFRQFMDFWVTALAREREVYENNEASEFTRGRVSALRDMVDLMQGK